MSSIDKLLFNNLINRPDLAKLFAELERIEKQKKDELKLINNERQRIKAKYSNAFKNSLVEMYGNHSSSFHFKKADSEQNQQSRDFENLKSVLFTNGEIDVEKVLCLHLLSVHKTEHLSRPRATNKLSFRSRKHFPLEQLLERSKRKNKNLPTIPAYVLDVTPKRKDLIHDGRLSARLLVNEKVSLLIKTIMTTLQKSNTTKRDEMLQKANDPKFLESLFSKPHILEFLKMLKNNSLLTSCDCFTLTEPFKIKPIIIAVKDSMVVESLMDSIRSGVLQLPTKKIEKAPQVDWTKEPTQSLDLPMMTTGGVDYVAKNIVMASTYRRPRKTDESSRKASRSAESRRKSSASIAGKTKAKEGTGEKKYHLKQTTCAACMEKWREPLPTPKTPKLRRTEAASHLQSNRLQRLSTQIDEELYRLNSYDRRFSNAVPGRSRHIGYTPEHEALQKKWENYVKMDVYDLEKIKQEIREKETKKKLDKFLAQ